MNRMATVYHTPQHRTRAATWVPRRVYYVLAYLKRCLTPGTPQAISNKHIQAAIRFGSEGEVSQIMRWLAGELPTTGRWAYKVLATEQVYRFITRDRLPSGGYCITLLARPEPLAARTVPAPEPVQLSFLDDPSMIPLAADQDARNRGSFSPMSPAHLDRAHSSAADRRSQRDHPKESHEERDQEQESAHPLFARLMAQPQMSRKLAAQIAQTPIGSVADFETDLALAHAFARSPFFFTVARWRDGQRVVAPEEPQHERPTPTRGHGARRRAETHRTTRDTHPAADADYAAYLAECLAAPLASAENLGLPVPGRGRAAHGS